VVHQTDYWNPRRIDGLLGLRVRCLVWTHCLPIIRLLLQLPIDEPASAQTRTRVPRWRRL